MPETMTARQRWLAALQGQPVDRLPFWPKLSPSWLAVHGKTLGVDSLLDAHRLLRSDAHEFLPSALTATHSTCSVTIDTQPKQYHHTRYETPIGTTELKQHWDEGSASWHPVVHPCTTVEGVRIMTAFIRDTSWHIDDTAMANALQIQTELGESACTATGIGESALMYFVEWLAGVEEAHFLLMDEPDAVGELFSAIHKELLTKTTLLAEHHPADCLYFIENTSTTLISPQQYQEWCLPHIQEYQQVLDNHRRLMVLHMCGTLKNLLPDVAQTKAHAFEAFTTPPVGDATLTEGRANCPNVTLIGGTNATLWMHPADMIIAELRKDLDRLPHTDGLIITSGGVMPPMATPETIRTVAEWVHAYPLRPKNT